MLLLTDGAVMCQDTDTPNWWKLIPDNYGDYVNGTWAGLAKGESAVSGILCQREAEPVCCGAGEGDCLRSQVWTLNVGKDTGTDQ